jgi:hypothetical protein
MSGRSPRPPGPGHIVLLGDSIFDNSAYTGGEPDVVAHLRGMLPDGWRAALYAVDGATTDHLAPQLARVPEDAAHLVVAIGGNDALQNIDLLDLRVSSTGVALSMFADRLSVFERAYGRAVDQVMRLGRAVTVCTIYNGALDDQTARLARVALMMFNDVILRAAFERGMNAIELRTICAEAADYANAIEPSGQGGRKIAAAVARAVGAVDTGPRPSQVWAGY